MDVCKLSANNFNELPRRYLCVMNRKIPQQSNALKGIPMVRSDNCLTAGKLQPIITKAEIAKCVINKITE